MHIPRPLLPFALLLGLLAGCAGRPQVHEGPVVFITLNGLRADVVSFLGGAEPGLTPNLDRLMASASWAGRAISPSSSVVASTAALLTGLRPWQTQVLRPGMDLSADLLTLPEALQAVGYSTHGYYSGHWMERENGYGQGFDSYELLGDADDALDRLAHLKPGRELVWVHIPEPQPPYVRRNWLLSRLRDPAPDLPPQVRSADLARYLDPASPPPPAVRRRLWDLYRLHAAWADERLGRLLDALRQSGQWDKSLVVVTSTYGAEPGLGSPDGGLGGIGGLGRERIEVPLAVKLPAGWKRPIAIPKPERVAALRLWATVVEAVGGPLPPAVAPSLFVRALKPLPIVSELYSENGTNTVSLVEGDDQLLRESRFAPAEPEYYRALLVDMPGAPPPVPPLREDSEVILGRLAAAFAAARPLTGISPSRLTLLRWEGKSGSRRVDDPQRQAELARDLSRAWHRFVPRELSPAAEGEARRIVPKAPDL